MARLSTSQSTVALRSRRGSVSAGFLDHSGPLKGQEKQDGTNPLITFETGGIKKFETSSSSSSSIRYQTQFASALLHHLRPLFLLICLPWARPSPVGGLVNVWPDGNLRAQIGECPASERPNVWDSAVRLRKSTCKSYTGSTFSISKVPFLPCGFKSKTLPGAAIYILWYH